MKYTIKGEKVVKEEVSIEVEADTFLEAYKKSIGSFPGCELKVSSINNEHVTSETEADWLDSDHFEGIFDDDVGGEFGIRKSSLKSALLRNRPVENITVHFSGQGDDGQVDYISVEPSQYEEILQDKFGVFTLSGLVGDLSDAILENVPIDWVNDSGGAGQISFSLNNKDELIVEVECHEWETTEGFTFWRELKIEE
jgi:hypothetical protein